MSAISMATESPGDAPVVLITGGARRLGAAMAMAFHQQGFRLAIHYHQSRHDATQLAATLPGSKAFQADLAVNTEIEHMVQSLKAHFGRLDVLINNASTYFPTPLDEVTEGDWHKLMASNLTGPFFLSRSLATELAGRGGTIVNMADINGRQPLRGYSVYSLAKAGMIMLTRAMARELAPQVRVNGIAPGSILWPEGDAGMNEEAKQALLERIPLGRCGNPADIAHLALLLATNPGYMTGQVIAVDGGLNLAGGYD